MFKVVQSVNLSGNSVRSAGEQLAQSMQLNELIREIRVKAADLSPGAGASFGALLHNNSSITLLDMSSNKIGDRGLSSLLMALQTNSTVRTKSSALRNENFPAQVPLPLGQWHGLAERKSVREHVACQQIPQGPRPLVEPPATL
eukprot:765205-Hanusia_phi.AAC.1